MPRLVASSTHHPTPVSHDPPTAAKPSRVTRASGKDQANTCQHTLVCLLVSLSLSPPCLHCHVQFTCFSVFGVAHIYFIYINLLYTHTHTYIYIYTPHFRVTADQGQNCVCFPCMPELLFQDEALHKRHHPEKGHTSSDEHNTCPTVTC